MADFSRRNVSSAILSKKLSNIHSFTANSTYDDVFSSPSKLKKSRILSSRVEDYSEIFNSCNSSPASSIPVLDLPAIDKRNGVASVPKSESDYSKIFGSVNEFDIPSDDVCLSGKSRDPSGAKSRLDTSDTDFSPKKQVPTQDATYQSVDDKKELKMFYNKSNFGINDGTNGKMHIAQFHAVPGFTCVIDEIAPLKSNEAINNPKSSINDVNLNSNIKEELMKEKLSEKNSPNLSDRGSKNGSDCEGSFSDGVTFNACDNDVNTKIPKVTPFSSPAPKSSESKSFLKKTDSTIYGTPKSDDYESTTEDLQFFSDDEVDENSEAAASAAAVKKAIEMAQESIRLAKEAMERMKSMPNFRKGGSFKNGLKVKKVKETKISGEENMFIDKKGRERSEIIEPIIQNLDFKDMENVKTDQVSPNKIDSYSLGEAERLQLEQNKQEGEVELEASKMNCDPINIEKYEEPTVVFEEVLKKEVVQTADKSDRKRWKIPLSFDIFYFGTKKSEVADEALKVDHFDAVSQEVKESENYNNKHELLEIIHDHEEKLEVVQEQVGIEEELKASQGEGSCEEELTELLDLVENENKSTNKNQEEHDDLEKRSFESKKQLDVELKLEHGHDERDEFAKKSENDYEYEENGRKMRALLEQEILDEENKQTLDVNKNLMDAHTEQDIESDLKTLQDQGQRLDEHHVKESSEDIMNGNMEKEKEEKKDLEVTQDSCTNIEINDQKIDDGCQQANISIITGDEEIYRGNDDNVEPARNMLTRKRVNNDEEIEKGSNKDEMENESENIETFGGYFLDRDSVDGDDDQIQTHVDDDLSEDSLTDFEVTDYEENATGLKVNELVEQELRENAGLGEDEFEEDSIGSSLKDENDPFVVEGLVLTLGELNKNKPTLGESNMNMETEQDEQKNEDSEFVSSEDTPSEKDSSELGDINNADETEVVFDQAEEINQIKTVYVDELSVEDKKQVDESNFYIKKVKRKLWNENILEMTEEIKTSQNTEPIRESLNKTPITEEREDKQSLHEDVVQEERERKKEKERERQVVERAIREARERAFVEARERAEKAAMEKATAEAVQRLNAAIRERFEKASSMNKTLMEKASMAEAVQRAKTGAKTASQERLAVKASMEAKLKAERAAVERATTEARERALEKAALSEKQRNTGIRRDLSSSNLQDHYQGQGPSTSSFKHSNSSNEKFDDGAKPESAERSKARLEKHQRIVERAAKALEEKNMRDLLAQREQAERNRFAEALDADVKRWSSGKTGNLRALLSTLQYILGPNSGWQPIPMTDILPSSAVKKAYRKATLFVHPDKLQQRGASIQQKYICEKIFDLLKDAWNKFDSEER